MISASIPTPFRKLPDDFNSFAESMTIRPPIKVNKTGRSDFREIKERPILHFRDSTWCALNKNFLYSKVYYGLTFSFYHDTSIKEVFPSFPNYRNYIATHISEIKIFLKPMAFIFKKKKRAICLTDENSKEAFNLLF